MLFLALPGLSAPSVLSPAASKSSPATGPIEVMQAAVDNLHIDADSEGIDLHERLPVRVKRDKMIKSQKPTTSPHLTSVFENLHNYVHTQKKVRPLDLTP